MLLDFMKHVPLTYLFLFYFFFFGMKPSSINVTPKQNVSKGSEKQHLISTMLINKFNQQTLQALPTMNVDLRAYVSVNCFIKFQHQ